MRGLRLRVGLRNQWPWFPEPKAQLAEQPLTLARLQIHPELLIEVTREGFAIPNAPAFNSSRPRSLAQGGLHLGHLLLT